MKLDAIESADPRSDPGRRAYHQVWRSPRRPACADALLDAAQKAGKSRASSPAYHGPRCAAPRGAGRQRHDGGDARQSPPRPISDRFERAIAAIPEIVAGWSVGGVDYILKVMTRTYDAISAGCARSARTRTRHRPLFHLHRHEDGKAKETVLPFGSLCYRTAGRAGIVGQRCSHPTGTPHRQSLSPFPHFGQTLSSATAVLDNLSRTSMALFPQQSRRTDMDRPSLRAQPFTTR